LPHLRRERAKITNRAPAVEPHLDRDVAAARITFKLTDLPADLMLVVNQAGTDLV
jgi:hypothetical protein